MNDVYAACSSCIGNKCDMLIGFGIVLSHVGGSISGYVPLFEVFCSGRDLSLSPFLLTLVSVHLGVPTLINRVAKLPALSALGFVLVAAVLGSVVRAFANFTLKM
jgi:hypothetical protein